MHDGRFVDSAENIAVGEISLKQKPPDLLVVVDFNIRLVTLFQ